MHRAIQERGGAEATAFSGRGGKSGNIEGVQRLWVHPRNGPIFQIPGESTIGGRLLLAGSDPESDEGAGGLEGNDTDTEQGGGKAAGVHIFPRSRRPVGVALWCGAVGGYSPHGTVHGGVPRPGVVAADREAATAEVGR